jgi:hypothetical protein
LWDAAVWCSVAGLIASVFAWRPLHRLFGLLHQHAEDQRQIADLLNTDTEGGITEVVDAIRDASPSQESLSHKGPRMSRQAHP